MSHTSNQESVESGSRCQGQNPSLLPTKCHVTTKCNVQSNETVATHSDSSNNSHISYPLSDGTPIVEDIGSSQKESNQVDEFPATVAATSTTINPGGPLSKIPRLDALEHPRESNYQPSIKTTDETVNRRKNNHDECFIPTQLETKYLEEELGERGLPFYIEFQERKSDDDTHGSSLLSLGDHSYFLDLQRQADTRDLERDVEVFEEAYELLITSSSEYSGNGSKPQIPEALFLAVFRALQKRKARRFREEDAKHDRLLRDAKTRLQKIPPVTMEDHDVEDDDPHNHRVLLDAKQRLQSIPPLEDSDDEDTLSDLGFVTETDPYDESVAGETMPLIQLAGLEATEELDLETVESFSGEKSNRTANSVLDASPGQMPMVAEKGISTTKHPYQTETRLSWIEWDQRINAAIKIQAVARRSLIGRFQPSEEWRREQARVRAATKIQAVARRVLVGRFRPARIHAAVKIQAAVRRLLAHSSRASMTTLSSMQEDTMIDNETPVVAYEIRDEEASNIFTDDDSEITYEEIYDYAGTVPNAGDCVSCDFTECTEDVSFTAAKSIQSQAVSYDEITCDENSHLDYNYDALSTEYEEFSLDDSVFTGDIRVPQFEREVILIQTWARKLAAVDMVGQKRKHVLILQGFVRMLLARSRFRLQQIASLQISTWVRARLAVILVAKLRRGKAAMVIQTRIRGNSERLQFQRKRKGVTIFQAYARGITTRKDFHQKKEAVMTIQGCIRTYLARRILAIKHQSATIIQAYIRGFTARQDSNQKILAARIIQRMVGAWQANRVLMEARDAKLSVIHERKLTGKSNKVAQKWKKTIRKILKKKTKSKQPKQRDELVKEKGSYSERNKRRGMTTTNFTEERAREPVKPIARWERPKLRSRVASDKPMVQSKDSLAAKLQEVRKELNSTQNIRSSFNLPQSKHIKRFTGRKIVKKKGLNLDSMWS